MLKRRSWIFYFCHALVNDFDKTASKNPYNPKMLFRASESPQETRKGQKTVFEPFISDTHEYLDLQGCVSVRHTDQVDPTRILMMSASLKMPNTTGFDIHRYPL